MTKKWVINVSKQRHEINVPRLMEDNHWIFDITLLLVLFLLYKDFWVLLCKRLVFKPLYDWRH